ncbi:DUF262 domain-containing protein [Natronorubrum texcoconense]|uniref:DUF262 domain-containing protein n=1 Tax=Natronorubrum texcoconense TaxID=1095776 RepID=A0A1G8UZ00_9EURY|nr:DUF262 domain-containing protein [Natronorubrum texcoconense]SDJ58949.1 Protein of unknown function DUF262 [Natronorubrum texcoconense]
MSFTASGYHHGITTDTVSIGTLLARDQVYKMVDNQRPVAWGAEQMQENFDDVDALPEVNRGDDGPEGHETHFLGVIELQVDSHYEAGDGPVVQYVVDGQQRMVAASLLVACLTEKYRELGDPDAARELTRKYLETQSRDGTETTVRLTQLYDDEEEDEEAADLYDEEFQMLLDDPTTPKDAITHDKLGDLIHCIRTEIDARVKGPNDIERLEERFLHRQVVGVFNFSESYSPYRLSEGCNGRGVHWGPVDHIKNRLMELAEEPSIDKPNVERSWREARRNLDEVNESRALRYWVMAYPHVPVEDKITNSKLYDTVKEIMDERLDEGALTLEDYAGDLATGTEYYRDVALANITHYRDDADNAEINRHLENLNKIGATPPRILVVRALYTGLPADELISILEMTEKMSLARRVVERRVPQEVRAYITLAHSAFEPGVDTVAAVREELEDLMPSKPEFERAFARMEWNKGKKTQYVLSTLEHEHFRSGSSSRFGGRTEGDVEHIAPRGSFDTKKYSAWGDSLSVTQEEFELDVDRIGNLTLLESRLNIAASNDPFDQKAPHYADSQYTMANEVADNYNGWSMNDINDRSEELAETAADIWVDL